MLHASKRVAASAPIKNLAIGSSSTAGAGASSAATTYSPLVAIEPKSGSVSEIC